MPLLYESYSLVRTIDPARRTPVIPSVDEHSGVEEVGLVKRLQAGDYSHWISFAVGMGVGYVLFSAMGRRYAERALVRVTR